ncbi:hypothetical protein [Siccirubricoccus phaeus]|uniref:hypothetical protein n=1 Tax=Siccirubricoccus phaeus TaxID=2595053 RepID=UPI0011F275C6|nr:hypothetical protein [Siccirubricoccus phaeus]
MIRGLPYFSGAWWERFARSDARWFRENLLKHCAEMGVVPTVDEAGTLLIPVEAMALHEGRPEEELVAEFEALGKQFGGEALRWITNPSTLKVLH